MTYPDHFLLSFGGALGSQAKEHWSCGIRMVIEGGGEPDEGFEDNYLDATGPGQAAIGAWFLRANTHISGVAFLDWMKFNRIGPDGNYADPNHPHTVAVPHYPGGGGVYDQPYSVCVVVTTQTAFLGGPASRGRFYQPLPDIHCGSDGRFNSQYAQEIVNSASTMLEALVTSALLPSGSSLFPHVVSARGSGATNRITSVSVDNRPDTQRRRANQIQGVRSLGADIIYP